MRIILSRRPMGVIITAFGKTYHFQFGKSAPQVPLYEFVDRSLVLHFTLGDIVYGKLRVSGVITGPSEVINLGYGRVRVTPMRRTLKRPRRCTPESVTDLYRTELLDHPEEPALIHYGSTPEDAARNRLELESLRRSYARHFLQ